MGEGGERAELDLKGSRRWHMLECLQHCVGSDMAAHFREAVTDILNLRKIGAGWGKCTTTANSIARAEKRAR